MDVLRLQKAAECAIGIDHFGAALRSQTLPLGHNATDVLIVIAVGLAGTATVFGLLTAPGYLLTRIQDGLPSVFPLGAAHVLRGLLVDEELTALDADTAKHLQNHFVELDVIHWTGQLVVPEMAGALMVVETAGAAQFPILQHTHARIGKAADDTFLRTVSGNLHYGASCDLIWAEHPKLDTHNGFGF